MNAQPLPIEDDTQEQYPRDGVSCGATMASPVGPLVCDRELLHPGGHTQGGANRMAKTMSGPPIADHGDTVTWVNREGEQVQGVVEMIGNGSTGDRIYGVRLPNGEYTHIRQSRINTTPEGMLW